MFNDLKVIELASVLAGPSVGQFFAELGAEVIKIENPTTNGDVTRSWKLKSEDIDNDISAYFTAVNWGKKSVLLDITIPDNLQQLYKLIEKADIVIASYKPGDAQILKVDYETLSRINPQLIYGHITGYGVDSSRLGYDAIIQAESGFMYINGEKNGNPVKMPVALIDVLAGHQLKEAILVALINRLQKQKGSYVQVSLLDTAISSLVNQAANYLVAGVVPQRTGSEHPNIAPYGSVYTTKDNFQIVLAVGNDKQFISLCKVLNLNNLANNEKFKSNYNRVQNREELKVLLSNNILEFEKNELLKLLEFENVPAGAINDMEAVFSNCDSNLIFENETFKGVKTFVAKGLDLKLNISNPPHLGEHTDEII